VVHHRVMAPSTANLVPHTSTGSSGTDSRWRPRMVLRRSVRTWPVILFGLAFTPRSILPDAGHFAGHQLPWAAELASVPPSRATARHLEVNHAELPIIVLTMLPTAKIRPPAGRPRHPFPRSATVALPPCGHQRGSPRASAPQIVAHVFDRSLMSAHEPLSTDRI